MAKTKNRLLSAFLALAILLALLPFGSLTAFAEDTTITSVTFTSYPTKYIKNVTGDVTTYTLVNDNGSTATPADVVHNDSGYTVTAISVAKSNFFGKMYVGIVLHPSEGYCFDPYNKLTISTSAEMQQGKYVFGDSGTDVYVCPSTTYVYTNALMGYGFDQEFLNAVKEDDTVLYYEPTEFVSPSGSAVITYNAGFHQIEGTVALNGYEKVGQKLTATYTYPDGKSATNYTVKYEWYRVDGTTETKLDNTDTTYTLVDDDKDKMIKVKVVVNDGKNYWTSDGTNITAITDTIGVFSTSYEMTFPADTTVTSDDFTPLTNGLKIKNTTTDEFDTAKKVTVTATSANVDEKNGNKWYLAASGADTKIHFDLLAKEGDTTATTSFGFSAAEIDKKDNDDKLIGTTKAIGVKANEADMEAAEQGTYTDTLTFTAKLEDVSAG